MKDVIVGMAEYNRKANAKLVGIMRSLPAEILREDQGSYYKSVLGTLEHILSAEAIWLKRYKTFFTSELLDSSALVAADIAATKERASRSPEDLYTLLAEVDALYVSFARALDPKDLSARVKYKNVKGEEFERPYWATIFQVLNHGTHHRGEISALLDRKGIANDYASFANYID